jgi:hypothetical protein
MPLALPYKVSIQQAQPDIDQGRSLLIVVQDVSANFRSETSLDVQDPTLQDPRDVRLILSVMYTALIQQLIADSGDVGAGLQALSLQAGG